MRDTSYIALAVCGEPLDTRRGLVRVLIGPPAAGKTSLCAAEGTRIGTRLSLDDARAQLGAGEHDQDATPAAVDHVRKQAHALLAMEAEITIDATSTTPAERATWLEIAREHQVPAVAVIVWAPLDEIRSRNAARPRPVPDDIVGCYWYRTTILSADDLIEEGFHSVYSRIPPSESARETAAPAAVPPVGERATGGCC